VSSGDLLPANRIVDQLTNRKDELEGVVISGGEPTIQDDLPVFIAQFREMGLNIKLDTNGSRPHMLQKLLQDKLLDYIAMDVKAPLHRYSDLAGVSVQPEIISQSIDIIGRSGICHEFRTTLVTPLLSDADLNEIKKLIPAGSKYITQPFRREYALDPALRSGKYHRIEPE
jgi:pyruvate formate lyase activating enzyme